MRCLIYRTNLSVANVFVGVVTSNSFSKSISCVTSATPEGSFLQCTDLPACHGYQPLQNRLIPPSKTCHVNDVDGCNYPA